MPIEKVVEVAKKYNLDPLLLQSIVGEFSSASLVFRPEELSILKLLVVGAMGNLKTTSKPFPNSILQQYTNLYRKLS
jgi:hypothetical protein